MAIPTIKCKHCGYIFSLEMKEDGNTRWYDIDPEHRCLAVPDEKKEVA